MLHQLPHKVCESTCYVNGLEDLLAWKGANYTDFLLAMHACLRGELLSDNDAIIAPRIQPMQMSRK